MGKHEDNGPPYIGRSTVLVQVTNDPGFYYASVFRADEFEGVATLREKPLKHRLRTNFATDKKVRYFTSTGELRKAGGYTATQHVDHVQRELEIGALWKKSR